MKLIKKTRHPIIVLDGPDGCGKTSLGDELIKLTNARYIHLTYRFKDRMHVYHAAALRLCARLAGNQTVILDRWWPSEHCYAAAYRGGSTVSKYTDMLEQLGDVLGVTYVMCMPKDKEKYLRHYNVLKGNREEMYDEGMDRVYDEYWKLYMERLFMKPSVMHYDFMDFPFTEGVSREKTLSDICQIVLEHTHDHRSDLND